MVTSIRPPFQVLYELPAPKTCYVADGQRTTCLDALLHIHRSIFLPTSIFVRPSLLSPTLHFFASLPPFLHTLQIVGACLKVHCVKLTLGKQIGRVLIFPFLRDISFRLAM